MGTKDACLGLSHSNFGRIADSCLEKNLSHHGICQKALDNDKTYVSTEENNDPSMDSLKKNVYILHLYEKIYINVKNAAFLQSGANSKGIG